MVSQQSTLNTAQHVLNTTHAIIPLLGYFGVCVCPHGTSRLKQSYFTLKLSGVAGENIVTNNNLSKNNLSITPYAKTTWQP